MLLQNLLFLPENFFYPWKVDRVLLEMHFVELKYAPKNSNPPPDFELTPELLKDFIEVQRQKTLNDAKEIQMKQR